MSGRARIVGSGSSSASTRREAARRRHYERRLRNSVKRDRGCLGSLPGTTRDLLGLRAGLDGPALSRPEAAARLDISRRTARQLEHSGLRELHVACAGGSAPSAGGTGPGARSANLRLVSLAQSAPALQPATALAPGDSAAATETSDLRGSGEVKGATASSDLSDDAPRVAETTSSASVSADGAAGTMLPLVIAAILALMAALALVGLRRRAVPRQGGTISSATAASAAPATVGFTPAAASAAAPAPTATRAPEQTPEPQPEAQPEAAKPEPQPEPAKPQPGPVAPTGSWAGPSADAGKTVVRQRPPAPRQTEASTRDRVVRSASAVAVGAVSFAVRELRRRRSGRRR